jgi:branched-subunit amino acid ABC-type transport system permease component
MTFDTFIIQLANGLVFSLLLFLMAAGLSLIFGLMDVINLAHGTFYLLGGYLGLTLMRWTGNFWLALLVAPILVGALGLLLEITLLRRLYRRGHLDQVLFTFGAALIGADMMRWTWGSYVETVATPELLAGQVDVMGIAFPIYRLTMIALGLLIAALLWLVIGRTRIGAIVRAGVSDAQMVSGLGINIQRVFAGVFAAGAGLAALSGVAAAPIVNLYPGLDFEILILAMVVVVVGGLGTLKGAFWGSLLIGMADTFGKSLLPQFSVFVIFVIMALVLLLKPAGLSGRSLALNEPHRHKRA